MGRGMAEFVAAIAASTWYNDLWTTGKKFFETSAAKRGPCRRALGQGGIYICMYPSRARPGGVLELSKASYSITSSYLLHG